MLSPAEYYVSRFYLWETRGRGWLLAEQPIHLEPPFIPFERTLPANTYIDDSKRPTLLSTVFDFIKGKKKPNFGEPAELDYQTIEPYIDEEEPNHVGLQIKLPKDRTIPPESMKALITMMSSGGTMISFEIIGTAKEIVIQFVCDAYHASTLETQINAYFPKLSVLRTEKYIEGIFEEGKYCMTADFGLRDEFVRPIAMTSNFKIDPLTGLIGVLESLTGEERGGIQILFAGTLNGWSNSIIRSVTMRDGSSFFEDAPESPKLAQEKTKSPLFAATIRVFAQGEDEYEASSVLNRIGHTIRRATTSDYNMLLSLPAEPYAFQTRIDDIYLRTSHRLGMLLNTDELLTLLHFPSEYIHSKKLLGGSRKTKALPEAAKGHSFKLGINTHNDKEALATVSAEQRLKHAHIIGATGTGKSTLLLSMIAQDMEQGNGIAVLDPHGDLIEAILPLVPKKRIQDVVVVDPADSEYPIGFNILQAHSEIEKEVLSSDLVAVFKRNSTSWGDQMNSVFANAVIAFLESSKGGSLADLRRFLIEKSYREAFLKTVTDPSVTYYWLKEYPVLKTNSVGPILTRLDTFLRPKLIRNMVCQQKGLDFERIMDEKKILLVKLSQGLIGEENSHLLGSFVVAKIQQGALARQAKQQRNDFFCYIDEFHHFLTPSMSGILTGTRKYHLGLVLAHQDLQQLKKSDSDIASAVSNVGTRICMRVSDDDAKKLADGFASFDAQDLQNLETGQAIARIATPAQDFSFDVGPVSKKADDQYMQQIIDQSRKKYGTAKSDVEALLAQTMNVLPDDPQQQSSAPKQESRKEKPIPSQADQPSTPATPSSQASSSANEELKESISKRKEQSQHRYLQTLIKKMAESKGYKATIEAPIPGGNGKVDVLLEKDDRSIACEVSVTTDAQWELHNIQKCLAAGYTTVLSCVGSADTKRVFQQRVEQHCSGAEQKSIHIFLPEELFTFLDQLDAGPPQATTTEQTMKGYRVKVSYDALTEEQKRKKEELILQIVRGQKPK